MLKILFSTTSFSARELRQRLMFLVLALLVFRAGAHVRLPGVDALKLHAVMESGAMGALSGLLNMMSGGSFSKLSVFALGLMPYLTASLVVQLAALFVPALEALKKEGDAGQRVITRYTRLGTLGLALFQGFGIVNVLLSAPGLVTLPSMLFTVSTLVTLCTGTLITMWLGEQITERGLGNGVSILIFASIAASIPSGLVSLFDMVRVGSVYIPTLLAGIAMLVLVPAAVVVVEKGERRLGVSYARGSSQGKALSGPSINVPLKLNMAGVMPPILAATFMAVPSTLADWTRGTAVGPWAQRFADVFAGFWPSLAAYCALIVAFTFLYTSLTVNGKKTAEQLQSANAFIPGFRPGEQTASHVDSVLRRLTLAGAVYITLACLLPSFANRGLNLPFNFGGTSLLITVVVALEFAAQARKYTFSQHYGSLLRKAPSEP